jgi:tetratricopeptide (TPR) repeat protein
MTTITISSYAAQTGLGARPACKRSTLAVSLSLIILLTTGCSRSAPNKDQLLSSAAGALAAGQFVKAEKDYLSVLRLAPNDPTALHQLATIYYEQGQLPQAYPLLKKSAELQPDNVDVQLKLGMALLAMGGHAEARDVALASLEKEPGNEEALILLASTALTPKDADDTQKVIESLRQHDGNKVGYVLALGVLDARRQQQDSAERHFKEALVLDQKSSKAQLALASVYFSQNRMDAAAEAFKAAADSTPDRSPIRLKYADFLLKTGAGAEAQRLLEEMTRRYAEYLPPRVALMNIACTGKRDDGCASRVKGVLAQDPNNFDAVLQDGLLSLDKGEATRAIRDFEYLSNTFPRNPNVRYQLALSYLLSAKGANEVSTRNAIEAAEGRLNEAIKLTPLLEPAVLLFAELKIKKGNAAAAIEPLQQLIKQDGKIAQVHYLLASAYAAQQQNDQALAVYRQMTEKFPQEAQPHFLIGTIRLAQRQPSQAREAFEKSLAIAPDFLPAAEMLVDLDIAEKQFAAGIDRIQKLFDRNSDRASLWALRAKLYLAQQDTNRAEQDLLKAIELDPKLTPAYLLLAQLYVVSNRQEQAIDRLNSSLKNNENASALLLLASIHERMKNFSSARDAYEKMLSVSPNSPVALNNLAVIYSEHLGQIDKALDLAKRAREAAPNEPHLGDTLGWIVFKKGDHGNAHRILQESASKLPNDPEVQFHAGMGHYVLGDEELARVAFEKAINSNLNFPGKNESERRLAILNMKAADPNARAELNNYLRQNSSDPVAQRKLAAIEEREGASDQAVKTYEKIVSEYPSFAPAIKRLAILYTHRPADSSKALEFATKARQAYPSDAEVAKALGLLNFKRELYPRSVELLREAAAQQKDDAEIAYYLGEAHRHLGQLSECKNALEEALRLRLSPQLAEQAKRNLAECS